VKEGLFQPMDRARSMRCPLQLCGLCACRVWLARFVPCLRYRAGRGNRTGIVAGPVPCGPRSPSLDIMLDIVSLGIPSLWLRSALVRALCASRETECPGRHEAHARHGMTCDRHATRVVSHVRRVRAPCPMPIHDHV
jgi:hypothetical protein